MLYVELSYSGRPSMYYIIKGNKVTGTKNTIWLGKKSHRNKKHILVRKKKSQEKIVARKKITGTRHNLVRKKVTMFT
jgi:uncharacterized protein YpmB